jgi:Polysaccharide lyase/PKD domain
MSTKIPVPTGASNVIIDFDTATTPPPVNHAPVVNAGTDAIITLPVNSVQLLGTASDPDGSIVKWLWAKINGTGGTIATPNSPSTLVTGLSEGQYVIRLTVTDDKGASSSKDVIITVKATATGPNLPPVVYAGDNQTVQLPATSVTLVGNASDPDGTIVAWEWTKTSGPAATITTPNKVSTTITNFVAGSYVFTLKVTDDKGATKSDYVNLTVKAAGTVDPPPVDPPPAGDYGTLVYSTGYDKLSDIINEHGQQGNGGLSTTIFKTGPGSFKSVPANVSSGIRSEVQYDALQSPLEGAVEYDVMYVKIQADNCHSLQWHPSTDGGSAAPGLWHVSGKFVLTNWKGGVNTKYDTGVTIPANKWIHIVIQYKFGSSGYLKMTIDGVVVLNKTNIQVGDGSSPYLKVGFNSWAGSNSEIYYDSLRVYKK